MGSVRLRAVFFDFDGTLTTTSFLQRVQRWALSDDQTTFDSMSTAERLANFGGPERLERISALLRTLKAAGVQAFVLSSGLRAAIVPHLHTAGLLPLFARVFGRESSEMQAASGVKGSLIERAMAGCGWRSAEVLLVDDCLDHIRSAHGVCGTLHCDLRGMQVHEIDHILRMAALADGVTDSSTMAVPWLRRGRPEPFPRCIYCAVNARPFKHAPPPPGTWLVRGFRWNEADQKRFDERGCAQAHVRIPAHLHPHSTAGLACASRRSFACLPRFLSRAALEYLRAAYDFALEHRCAAVHPEWVLGLHEAAEGLCSVHGGCNWMWELATQPALLQLLRSHLGSDLVLFSTRERVPTARARVVSACKRAKAVLPRAPD